MTRRAALIVIGSLCLMVGCGPPSIWRGLSPDHRRAFEVFESGGRSCIAVDGGEPRCFDGIALSGIVFSPDSRSLSYPVRSGVRWVIVRDGTAGPPVDGIGELRFSPKGGRLAYSAERDGRWHVVVDGAFGEAFDSIAPRTLRFAPDGQRLAFVAYRDDEVLVVVDGVPGPPHDGVAQLRFSFDGASVAYLGRDADGVRLYRDGVVLAKAEVIDAFALGPTDDDFAFSTRQDSGAWVVRDAQTFGPYREVRDLRYRRNDGALFYVAREAAGERVWIDGRAEPLHASVDAPTLSDEGAGWGYVAHDSLGSVAVVAGKVVDVRPWIGDLVFNPDGSRYAYLTRDVDGDVVVDERGHTRFSMVVDGTLQFPDSGERWACLAGDFEARKLFVVVEGSTVTRPFEWDEFFGVADGAVMEGALSEVGREALRSWVAAEAALILAGGAAPE